jgi:hypothetical protein
VPSNGGGVGMTRQWSSALPRMAACRTMTNYLQDGAEIATMLGGLSVGTGVAVWIRNQVRGQRDRRTARRHRNWHGYIASGTVSSWHVRIAEDRNRPPAALSWMCSTAPMASPISAGRTRCASRCRQTGYSPEYRRRPSMNSCRR